MPSSLRTGMLWIALFLTTSALWGQNSKLAPDLQNIGLLQQVDVIVQYNRVPLLTDLLNIQLLGGTVNGPLNLVTGVVVRLTGAVLSLLSLDPAVTYITPDRLLLPTLDYAAPAVNADIAFQSGLTGAGVGIAVLDSGIYN